MQAGYQLDDTIIAPSTPSGQGALALIRLTGPKSIEWTEHLLGHQKLSSAASHTAHFGLLKRKDGSIVDEVVITVFKGPHSYTRQDVIEISCHGSDFIVQEILNLYFDLGARMAEGGEFTLRAYMNGQLDLSQAEAVADLIAAESQKAHELALNQLRGGFSKEIEKLRTQLIDFASLIELELDFGEEDVEFADRSALTQTVEHIQSLIQKLIDSFQMGNAVKKGISTVIAGRPNAGKSTLLNALLQEERAIVSEIEGTTRDTIEECIVIEGVQFRLIDTAGLREAADQIEAIGVQKTYEKIEQAGLVLFVFDAARTSAQQLEEDIAPFINQKYGLILIANKTDLLKDPQALHPLSALNTEVPFLKLSAATHEGLQELHDTLIQVSNLKQLGNEQAIVTNSRHYEALVKAHEDLHRVLQGLSGGVTSDFVAMDIRQALYHLGSITGEISTDDLLGNIFGKFCIGK